MLGKDKEMSLQSLSDLYLSEVIIARFQFFMLFLSVDRVENIEASKKKLEKKHIYF